MAFLLVIILIGISIFLYIKYKPIADAKLSEYKKVLYEVLQGFTSWKAFKKMLYGEENLPPKPAVPPISPITQRRRRVRVSPAKLNQEDDGYDVLNRKDEIESLRDYDKTTDQHPKSFELALLLNSKDAKIKKTNKHNLMLQRKTKPIKADEPSAFIKSKSAVNSLNKDK